MNRQARTRRIANKKRSSERPNEMLWCYGEWKPFPVYKVPIDALLLNIENRRFKAERKLMEEKLGRTLDPENNLHDETSVISILLDTNLVVDGERVTGTQTKDTDALFADWMQRKQERPIWIRPDGTVRNGNRRLAMLKRMVSKGALGIEWVNAIILDDDEVDEHELFALEQREQLTEEFKVRYTDINLLLTLRDAAVEKGIDWADPESIDKIAGELQHIAEGDKSYAIVQLQAIRAMDAYLHDSSADGQYQKLLRQVERFRDVGKNLARIERDYPDDAADMLQLMFAAIRAGNPHGDIRAIRKLFLRNRKRYEKLLEDVRKAEAGWEAGEGKLADPQVTKGRDEDNDSESEPPGPVVPNYPAAKVSSYIKNAIDSLTASELDVLSSLSQVANRLRQATPPMVAEALSGPEHNAIEDALSEIAAWLAEIEKIKAGGQKPRRTVKRGGL